MPTAAHALRTEHTSAGVNEPGMVINGNGTFPSASPIIMARFIAKSARSGKITIVVKKSFLALSSPIPVTWSPLNSPPL